MARGDVVFRRHPPEGAVVPEKTKRIDTTSKGMAKAFGRDPLTASAGADPDRQPPPPKQVPPSPSVAVEAEEAGEPEPKPKRRRKKAE